MRQMAAADTLQPADMVLANGAAMWQPASAVPGLFPPPPLAMSADGPPLPPEAPRLEPGEAAGLCARAARTLTQAMGKTTNPDALSGLARGLTAVAPGLEPGEVAQAARTLTQAMS
jgi:hypothetical protein